MAYTASRLSGLLLDSEMPTLTPAFKKVADVSTLREVVFATYEDEPAEIKRRLQTLANGMPWIKMSLDIIKQHLHIVDMRGIGSVWGPGIGKHIQNTGDLLSAGEDLRAICKKKKARLLVMQTRSPALSEATRTTAPRCMTSFRISEGGETRNNATVLVIGHLPKSKEGKEAGFSGTTAWPASVRSMWTLSQQSFVKGEKGEEEETKRYWTLEHTKSNYAPIQPPVYLAKQIKGNWWSDLAADREEAEAFEAYQQGRRIIGPRRRTHDDDPLTDLIANSL